jgi:acyl-coenzyme A synthetase/AMP-(fatty) acid ligase
MDSLGDDICLVLESGGFFSYRDLLNSASMIASSLRPRDVVMLICRNDWESVAAYVGFMRRGAVQVMMGDSVRMDYIAGLLEAYRPSYVFAPTDSGISGEKVCELGGYALVSTGYEIDYEVHPDLALLLSTSGSTGSPKLVRQTRRNIAANTESIIEYLRIASGDRAITTLPMSYTYGLSIINTHLYAGASLILTNRTLMDRSFWDALKKQGATTFGGVPYTYEMLKKLRFGGMNLPSVRYLTQAGGKLSAGLSLEFADICAGKGMKFIVMYGQTEATARMSYLPWKYARTKAGSIGVPIPGGSFSLKGADGEEIREPGVVGELVYCGPNVTPGYAENRFDLAKGDERQGVLETGDMAYFDDDGFYYISGRKKRFLKLFGNRVNMDEIEALMKSGGFDCACGGSDDSLKIYTTSHDIAGARAFLLERSSVNPAGFSIIQVGEIPKNPAGKVLYRDLEFIGEDLSV